MHRDMKPQNIMLDQFGKVKLIDFGQTKKYCLKMEKLNYTAEIGTLWYKAPEIILGSSLYGHKIDMWAVGCIMA